MKFYVVFYFVFRSVRYLLANTTSANKTTVSQGWFLSYLGQLTEFQYSNFHCVF